MQSALTVMSNELTEIKEKYSVCSAELVVKQIDFDELSSAFSEHVKGWSEQIQLANQNTERVTVANLNKEKMTAEKQQQEKAAGENIKRLTGELEEKSRCLEEMQHLIEAEMQVRTELQQQVETFNRCIEAKEETIRELTDELGRKTRSLEEERHVKKLEASFGCYHRFNRFVYFLINKTNQEFQCYHSLIMISNFDVKIVASKEHTKD